MRSSLLAIAVLAVRMFAQTGMATVTGVISDPNGTFIPTASVQIKNVTTGAIYKTVSGPTGAYSIPSVPPGTYDLAIPSMGFMYTRFERKAVSLTAGQMLKIDVRLAWSGNLGTPGDDITILVKSKHPAPSGPAPRMPDGKPDLSGVYVGSNDPNPEQPQLLPWAEKITNERRADGGVENPGSFCLPGDVLLRQAFLYKIVQQPNLIVLIWEGNLPSVHQIFMDGRQHPKDWNPSWMGHSIAHWDGDTLLEDVVGFNDRSWLGLFPHTEMLHVVNRYRRVDLGHLEKEITIEDPGTFVKPWKVHVTWDLIPGEELLEEVCENNRDADHLKKK